MATRTAGSLTAEDLNKTLRVQYKTGNVTHLVEDRLEKVTHRVYPSREGTPTLVTLHFFGTRWHRQTLFGGAEDEGLTVPVDQELEVD